MILIKNGTVYPMISEPILNGSILIDGKKIKRVFSGNDALPDLNQENLITIDAKGGWILPGIIESHCHMGIIEDRIGSIGDDLNESVNPITPFLSALDAINPMDATFQDAIRAGITSAMIGPGSSNVVGGQFVFMKTYGRVVDHMVVLAPAAMKIAFGENPKTNYKEHDRSPVTRMATAAMLREEIIKAIQYKTKKERLLKEDQYFEEEYRYECWLPVLEKRIPLKAHAHRADDIMTSVRIAKEFHLEMTLDHCSDGYLIADEISQAGFPAVVGPGLTSRYKEEMRNIGFKTPGILAKAGVTISITTDHPVCAIQALPICAGLAVKEGLPLEEGLRAITLNAARICKVDSRVGSLAVGMDADIAIFDGNPMETFTKTLYTIIDGKIVYDYAKEKDGIFCYDTGEDKVYIKNLPAGE